MMNYIINLEATRLSQHSFSSSSNDLYHSAYSSSIWFHSSRVIDSLIHISGRGLRLNISPCHKSCFTIFYTQYLNQYNIIPLKEKSFSFLDLILSKYSFITACSSFINDIICLKFINFLVVS